MTVFSKVIFKNPYVTGLSFMWQLSTQHCKGWEPVITAGWQNRHNHTHKHSTAFSQIHIYYTTKKKKKKKNFHGVFSVCFLNTTSALEPF